MNMTLDFGFELNIDNDDDLLCPLPSARSSFALDSLTQSFRLAYGTNLYAESGKVESWKWGTSNEEILMTCFVVMDNKWQRRTKEKEAKRNEAGANVVK